MTIVTSTCAVATVASVVVVATVASIASAVASVHTTVVTVIRVPNRLVKSATAARPKAELGNANHIGAPMPGVVASIGVAAGQKVSEGDLLLTIEAMKMETGIHAERDAVVKAVHVTPGGQIDAKDLLVEFED